MDGIVFGILTRVIVCMGFLVNLFKFWKRFKLALSSTFINADYQAEEDEDILH